MIPPLRKYLFLTGTRADWGLLLPLARLLRERGDRVEVAATNMHLDPALGHTVDELVADGFSPAFTIPASGSPSEIAAAAAAGFPAAFRAMAPDATVILGDRCEMLGAATAALLEGVPIVHIAGGTVSEGAFDDSIRHAITKMATLHLVETEDCRRRVVAMGEQPDRVVTVGSIGVWNVINTPDIPAEELERDLGMRFSQRTVLATLHAATLDPGSPGSRMQAMLEAFGRAMERYTEAGNSQLRFIITYPNNDVDPAPQIELIREFASRWPGRVTVVPSLGRRRYAAVLRRACAVVGNSSGGIVEVPSAGIPTLDIGSRQAGRQRAASVFSCGPEADDILRGLDTVLSDEALTIAARRENPYARPDTPQIMADAIEAFPFTPWPVKKFHIS